jgi:hypothetical protein
VKRTIRENELRGLIIVRLAIREPITSEALQCIQVAERGEEDGRGKERLV